jgi:hypothetical protein
LNLRGIVAFCAQTGYCIDAKVLKLTHIRVPAAPAAPERCMIRICRPHLFEIGEVHSNEVISR